MKLYKVVLQSWRDGLQKVELDKLLATDGRLGLAAAKNLVDRLLSGEEVSTAPLPQPEAESLAKKIDPLGANCTVEDVGLK